VRPRGAIDDDGRKCTLRRANVLYIGRRAERLDYLVRDERRPPQGVQFQLEQRGQGSFDVQRPRHVAGLGFEPLHLAAVVGAPERQRDPREVLLFLAGPKFPDL